MKSSSLEVLMRALVSNLTALLLVIHAMIGCCHHHWHSAAECGGAMALTATCDCCPQHPSAADADHPANDHKPCEPCSGSLECLGVCKFLPSSRVQLDCSDDEGDCLLVAVVDSLAAIDAIHHVNVSRRAGPRDALPPIRLHLLHQRLLV
jgi:hypothetical protein